MNITVNNSYAPGILYIIILQRDLHKFKLDTCIVDDIDGSISGKPGHISGVRLIYWWSSPYRKANYRHIRVVFNQLCIFLIFFSLRSHPWLFFLEDYLIVVEIHFITYTQLTCKKPAKCGAHQKILWVKYFFNTL